MIHFPCMVDGRYFENTRLAYRAVFLPEGVSYDKLQRALKRGRRELYGHLIERVRPRLAVGRPLRPGDDGADLVLQPRTLREKQSPCRGGSLLDMGLPPQWH